MPKKIIAKLVTCTVELNDADRTRVDCIFEQENHGPDAIIRHRRRLKITYRYKPISINQMRAVGKAIRLADRAMRDGQ